MNNEALPIFKVLADETRLKILRALDEKESYVELLAERLSLTPATVSFHMKKLLAAGLVDARREQYYTDLFHPPRIFPRDAAIADLPERRRRNGGGTARGGLPAQGHPRVYAGRRMPHNARAAQEAADHL